MGVRDWFKKKDNQVQSKGIEGYWNFKDGNTKLTVRNLTDTGVSYGDVFDGTTQMKLYTFIINKADIREYGNAGVLNKPYETVAFEAPADWNIEAEIQNGLLKKLIENTNAINQQYNNNRQIDLLGRFDTNGNFTQSSQYIQDYIDTTYTPWINEQTKLKQNMETEARRKAEEPGFTVKVMDKILGFFDGIKERRDARRDAKQQKLLTAAQKEYNISSENIRQTYSREELGLSSNKIEQYGRDMFRIGTEGEMLTDISIKGVPQMLSDGSYLYTANKQLANSFNSESSLSNVANCQFSLPIPPEQLNDFLMNCENPGNPNAKSNADALMMLLNKNPLPGRGLYMGGLYFGKDNNLYYHEFQHIQDSIDYINGSNNQINRQDPQRTSEYENSRY